VCIHKSTVFIYREETHEMRRKQFAFVVGPCRTRPSFHHWAHLTLLNGPASSLFFYLFHKLSTYLLIHKHTVLSNSTSTISKKRRKEKGGKLLFTSAEKKSCCISQGLVNLINSRPHSLFFPPSIVHICWVCLFYIPRSIVFCYTLGPSQSRAVQLYAV